MDFSNSSTDITFESTIESVSETSQKVEEQYQSNDLIEKIMLLYLKHNLTLVCLEDVMKLLNEILEDCKKLPTGKVQIMNMFKAHRELVDILNFVKCNKCKQYTKLDSENRIQAKCSRCSNGLKMTETNYFVSLPIKQQIVKSVKDNWTYIKKFVNDSESKPNVISETKNQYVISDAHDGSILRNVLDKYRDCELNILSLMINVDGANKFKSNSKSVWPIQLIQNYLPPTIRFLPQNIIVTGLQYVNSKDDGSDELNFREFLLPLVNELNDLKKNNIEMDLENETYKFKPVITHGAVDLPAKSKVQQTKQYGGYDSCMYCEMPGEPVVVETNKNIKPKKGAKGKANKKIYNLGTAVQTKPKEFIRYVENGKTYKARDEMDTLQKMLLASKSNGQNPIDGIKDVSSLVGFEHFNIIWSLSPEYMHCCLQGGAKRFGNYLFNPRHSGKDYYIVPRKRDALNKLILAIKPTSDIARKPRSLNQRAYFKASEYKSMLLYYWPVVLPGFVPNIYVKHIRFFSAAVYILLKEKIPIEEVDNSEKMLDSFVTQHQVLFGKENMVMVIHMLKHLAESVRQLGPLWCHSAFGFERNNGCLLKWVNGTSDVTHQISSKYVLSKTIQKPLLKDNMDSKVLLGKSDNVDETASHVFSTSTYEVLNFSNIKLVVYKRIRLKHVVYTSLMYTRPKRSIDYFIGLETGQIGTAKYYFEANNQIYVMMNQFKLIGKIYHISKVQTTNRIIVAPILEIRKKYIFLNIGINSYIVSPPNSYEKE